MAGAGGTADVGDVHSASATPELVLKYLVRYMTGGPISDRRLVSHAAGQVTFTARIGTTHGGSDATEGVSLPGAEFVRRWRCISFRKAIRRVVDTAATAIIIADAASRPAVSCCRLKKHLLHPTIHTVNHLRIPLTDNIAARTAT